MADGPIPREIEDERVISLDFLVSANARKDHFGAAAKTGKVVVSHGADGDQALGLDGRRVQTHGYSGAKFSDAHEFGSSAVVLDHPNRWGDRLSWLHPAR